MTRRREQEILRFGVEIVGRVAAQIFAQTARAGRIGQAGTQYPTAASHQTRGVVGSGWELRRRLAASTNTRRDAW